MNENIDEINSIHNYYIKQLQKQDDNMGEMDAIIKEQQQENKRLTDLLIYALLPKNIYNHELDINTMNKFIEIVSNNLQYDTHTIRQKLVECWNNIGKEKQSSIFEILEEKDNDYSIKK